MPSLISNSRRQFFLLKAKEPQEEEMESSTTEDWRAFRARLVEKGLTTTITASSVRPPSTTVTVSDEEAKKKTPKCDPQNLELARQQSAALGQELEESWAHEIGYPEVGGLLLRLPLEMQLVVAANTYWGKKLRAFAETEKKREEQNAPPPMLLEEEEDDDDENAATLGMTYLNDVLLYRVAGRFLKQELDRIAQKGTIDSSGRLVVDPRSLSDPDKALLDMRQQYLESWQEVILIVEHDPKIGCRGVTLNRPAASRADQRLSTALAQALSADEIVKEQNLSNKKIIDASSFDSAFGQRIAAYVGCPDRSKVMNQKSQAMLIHGIADLENARELSPGLGIFRGGLTDAIQRVKNKQNDPFDFRFFLGSYEWGPGEIEKHIAHGVYKPVACSRAIALKQCIALPQPMWHEIADMLGGSIKEVSRLELMKRNDSSASS